MPSHPRMRGVFGTLTVSVGLCVWSGAFAKDLDTLTRLLIPAYMAQSFAAVCVNQDRQFLAELSNGAGQVSSFAEHVKKEVTIDLPESDAAKVRITAADTARNVVRQELRLAIGGQVVQSTAPIKRWCDGSVKQFITEVMRLHEQKHKEFESRVRDATR